MQDPSAYLKEKLKSANFEVQLGAGLLLFSFLCLTPLIYEFYEAFTSPPFVEYEVNNSWWITILNIIGVFGTMGSISLLSGGLKQRRKFRYFLKEKKAAQVLELEVLDKYYYIKLLPGEHGPLEYHYFIGTKEGNWHLSEATIQYYEKLQPGASIKAAVLNGSYQKEIADLEIITPGQAPEAIPEGMIMDKIISEVKVTDYDKEGIRVNKLHLFKTIRYYLIIDMKVVKVNPAFFYKTPLHTIYETSMAAK